MAVSRSVFGLLVFAISACSRPDYGPPASQVTKETATRNWLTCLYERAAQLDDGVSDARTVGRSIAPSCRDQYAYMVGLYTQGEKPTVRAIVHERLMVREIDEAADAVLRRRARLKRK